jgi:hypothetical protein
MNHMREFITSLPRGQARPSPAQAIFILAGYSWREKDFRIWRLFYDGHLESFTFKPISFWRLPSGTSEKKIGFVGDEEPVKRAKALLVSKLKEKGRLKQGGLDMEPFEVLRDIIRAKEFPAVGGPPQVVKLYEHMNAVPFGIYWPNRSEGQMTIFGRPLMSYEAPPFGILDPDRPADRPIRGDYVVRKVHSEGPP